MAGAYVHIPFCSHICYYCDFNKVFIDGQPVDEYVDRLIQEMHMVMAAHPDEPIETVYIGGGTPTALSAAQLDRLCQASAASSTLPAANLPSRPIQMICWAPTSWPR